MKFVFLDCLSLNPDPEAQTLQLTFLSFSQCIHYQGTITMHLASSRSFTMAWNSRSARTLTVNTAKYGVQRPAIMTETGNGVIVRQTTMSPTARMFTAAVENGHEMENA